MHYTLCDMLADLTQNAIEAGSSKVTVEFLETEADVTVYIRDNGKGMDAQTLKRVTDPFYTDGVKHPKRKVGLGIPFLIQTVSDTGGEWNIQSEPGKGTTVFARFDMTNIDTPPIGDVSGFFRQILLFSGSYELEIVRKKDKQGHMAADKNQPVEYRVLRSELLDALGSLEDAQSLALLGEYLAGLES